MGPSGCGKTTLLRCLNRIHEIAPGARVEGDVLLDGENVYESEMSVIELRRRVGMVFQRPNPFPTLSIFGNVVCRFEPDLCLGRRKTQRVKKRCVRQCCGMK